MGSSSNHGAGEMCLDGGAGAGRRKKVAAAEKGGARQPQRGLGVAQLEKIRMQNQIMATYRSGMPDAMAAASSLHAPYLAECLEAMDRRIVADAQYSQYYAENLLPYAAATRQQQPPQMSFVHGAVKAGYSPTPSASQYYWPSSTMHDQYSSGAGSGTEELDLELRL